MGCLTGIITKSFLVAFNVVVAVAGLIVLVLASVIQTTLSGYGDEIPKEPLSVLIGLQTVSTCIICLGALGVVVSCCCGNKLFLYTYFVLGLILVIVTIVFASMGAANMNKETYMNDIRTNIANDVDKYTCKSSDADLKLDTIFKENECCGTDSFQDVLKACGNNAVPAGCCKPYTGFQCSSSDASTFYVTGCYAKLVTEIGDQAKTTFNFAIFFGILLFALLTSTCLCVKCTDTMPI